MTIAQDQGSASQVDENHIHSLDVVVFQKFVDVHKLNSLVVDGKVVLSSFWNALFKLKPLFRSWKNVRQELQPFISSRNLVQGEDFFRGSTSEKATYVFPFDLFVYFLSEQTKPWKYVREWYAREYIVKTSSSAGSNSNVNTNVEGSDHPATVSDLEMENPLNNAMSLEVQDKFNSLIELMKASDDSDLRKYVADPSLLNGFYLSAANECWQLTSPSEYANFCIKLKALLYCLNLNYDSQKYEAALSDVTVFEVKHSVFLDAKKVLQEISNVSPGLLRDLCACCVNLCCLLCRHDMDHTMCSIIFYLRHYMTAMDTVGFISSLFNSFSCQNHAVVKSKCRFLAEKLKSSGVGVSITFLQLEGFASLDSGWIFDNYGKLLLVGLWNCELELFETVNIWFRIAAKGRNKISEMYYSIVLLSCYKAASKIVSSDSLPSTVEKFQELLAGDVKELKVKSVLDELIAETRSPDGALVTSFMEANGWPDDVPLLDGLLLED